MTRMKVSMAVAVLVVFGLCGLAPTPATAQTFTGLAFGVADLSADGSVLVGSASFAPEHLSVAVRWTRSGGLTVLGTLPGDNYAQANGVSGNGLVVVGGSGGQNAFRWEDGVMESIDPFPGGIGAWAVGVNRDGAVIVGNCGNPGGGQRGFVWTPDEMLNTGTLPGRNSAYNVSVSGDGSVVVGGSDTNGRDRHAYRWTRAEGLEDLGTLPGFTQSEPNAVSADGRVVVGRSFNNCCDGRAFRWTREDGMQNLGLVPGATNSEALAVSADGSVVVGYCTVANGAGAFLWTAELGMVNLNTYLPTRGIDLTGWTLGSAAGISADGQTIAGGGGPENWIATLHCSGDLDNDGGVGLSDLSVLLAHFGTPSGASRADGDSDADGDVDLQDLAALLSNFGTTCP